MAIEHEIDRMVVRLVGNQDDYQKMLKDVERQTEQSAKWAEEQGSKISQAFNKAFKSAQGMMSNIGSTTQKAGGASAAIGAISAPLGKAAMDFSEYGKSVKDMVKETEKAAKEAEFMKKRLVENTEAYKELARTIKLTQEQAQVFKLMSERTGVSVSELTKTIKTNSSEYQKWREEAEKFGLVFDAESIANANKLAESWVRVKEALKGLWAQVGDAVAPAWKEFNDLIIGSVTWVTKWVKENKELIATIGKTAEKLILVGGVLTAIGTAISTLSTFLGPVVALVTAGAAAWLAWDTATGKIVRGSAAQVWEQYAEQVQGVVTRVIGYGKQILDHVNYVMDGVYNAIKAGNLELAVEIAWSGAKVAWMAGLNEIDKITGERFSAIFQNLAAGNWKSALEATLNEVLLLWNKLLLAIDPIFTQIVNKASTAWTEIVNGLDSAWVEIQNIVGMIQAVFKDAASNIMVYWTLVKTYFEGLGGFIKGTWDGAFGGMLAVAEYFVTNITTIFGKVKDVVIEAVSGFGGILGAAVTLPIKLAMEALSKVSGVASDIGDIESGITAAGAFSVFAPKTAAAAKMMSGAVAGIEGIPMVTGAQKEAEQQKEDRERHLKGRKETRTSETEAANAKRLEESYVRELMTKGQIIEIEERQEELRKQGLEDAAKALDAAKSQLETSVQQAQVQRDASEEQSAKSAEALKKHEDLRRVQLESLQLAQQYQGMMESYDPVAKYMRQMKELNVLLEESKKQGEEAARIFAEVYKHAIFDIKEELVNSSFKVNVEFGLTGMDAVRRATREEQQLVENTLEMLGRKRLEEKAMAEVTRRESAIKSEAQAKVEEERTVAQSALDKARENINLAGGDPEKYKKAKEEFARAQRELDSVGPVPRERIEELRQSLNTAGTHEEYEAAKSAYTKALASPQAVEGSDSGPKSEGKESLDRLNRVAIAVEKMADRDVVQLYPVGSVA